MRQTLMVSAAALTAMVVVGRSIPTESLPETTAVAAVAVSAPPPTTVPPAPAPSGGVEVRTADGGSFIVDASIAENVQRLVDHAAADGIVLGGWGLRSHQRQHELRRINGCPDDGSWSHSEGEDPSTWAPASSCRVPTARPGHSNHESGLAIDFTVNGSTIKSRQSTAFLWLQANAGAYGLQNLPSEPWHWSVNGK